MSHVEDDHDAGIELPTQSALNDTIEIIETTELAEQPFPTHSASIINDAQTEDRPKATLSDTLDIERFQAEFLSDMEEEPSAPKPKTGTGTTRLVEIQNDNGKAVSRIFDETEDQRETVDSNMRRNAIQHLRAAVAAARAERNAGSKLKDDADDSPYRNDLASVVRKSTVKEPARPSPSSAEIETHPSEETDQAESPLRLIAEQRVDNDQISIQPRRTLLTDTPATTDPSEGSFQAYTTKIGARNLPDLLEAAASYMSDIEGRAQFSRPMLIGKLKELDGHSEHSREDMMRSFGQLLREGKLQKLTGGQFAVTEETDFRGRAMSK